MMFVLVNSVGFIQLKKLSHNPIMIDHAEEKGKVHFVELSCLCLSAPNSVDVE